MWDASFAGADGNGWAGDASFATDVKKDTQSVAIGERLPVPATISDLLSLIDEMDDKYTLGTFKFTTTMTVGIVKASEEASGTYTYTLGDPENMENEFLAVKYSNNENSNDYVNDSNIAEGTRVRAIGKIKSFDGAKTIMLFNISEIGDEKEYKIFQLEAKAAKLFFEKNILDKMKSGEGKGLRGMLAPPTRRGEQSNASSLSGDHKERLYTNQKTGVKSGSGNEISVKEKLQDLLREVQEKDDGTGSSLPWIGAQVGFKDLDSLKVILDDMVNDGIMYHTDTDSCYAII